MLGAETAESFEDLIVWQKSHQLVLVVYQLSACFPLREMYGLTSQLRRAAVSVPANLAEGFKRRGTFDKARFINHAQASLQEARYFVILARDLSYTREELPFELMEEVRFLRS